MRDPSDGHTSRATTAGDFANTALSRPIIVSILYLAGLFTGFTVLIGLIVAYVWRNDPDVPTWEETHFTYLIRTFWIGFWISLLMVIGLLGLMLWPDLSELFSDHTAPPSAEMPTARLIALAGTLGIGFLTFLWSCVRSILSLANAANRRPMPKPKTCLF